MTNAPPAHPAAQFPRQSAASVRLFNLVTTRRAQLDIELGGQTTGLRIGVAPPAFIAPRNITLMLGNQRLWLALPKESLAQLCATWLSNEPFHHLPTLLRHSLISVALSPLLTSLGQLTGSNTRLIAHDDSVSSPDDTMPRLGLWQGDSAFGSLQLEHATAASLSSALQTLTPPAPSRPRWPNLPITLRLALAETTLTGTELLALEPGDVVLLPPDAADHPLTLCLGERRLASARIDRNQVTLAPLPETRMSDNDDISQDQPATAGLSAADLDVRLHFDLGNTTLSLAELQHLEPGYTFTLDRREQDVVRLRVGSRVIGHGELVQIDDRLGVRITSLFPGGDTESPSGADTGGYYGNGTDSGIDTNE